MSSETSTELATGLIGADLNDESRLVLMLVILCLTSKR